MIDASSNCSQKSECSDVSVTSTNIATLSLVAYGDIRADFSGRRELGQWNPTPHSRGPQISLYKLKRAKKHLLVWHYHKYLRFTTVYCKVYVKYLDFYLKYCSYICLVIYEASKFLQKITLFSFELVIFLNSGATFERICHGIQNFLEWKVEKLNILVHFSQTFKTFAKTILDILLYTFFSISLGSLLWIPTNLWILMPWAYLLSTFFTLNIFFITLRKSLALGLK